MPFEFLRRADARQVLSFLQDEHPQTVALVVAHMRADQAAIVISGMPDELQADVAPPGRRHGDDLPRRRPRVEAILERKLSSVLQSTDASAAGGLKPLVDIINHADRATERLILEGLERRDPALAEEVRSQMFMFEDITTLDDRSVQLVLRSVDSKELATALKGVSQDVRGKIMANVSERARPTSPTRSTCWAPCASAPSRRPRPRSSRPSARSRSPARSCSAEGTAMSTWSDARPRGSSQGRRRRRRASARMDAELRTSAFAPVTGVDARLTDPHLQSVVDRARTAAVAAGRAEGYAEGYAAGRAAAAADAERTAAQVVARSEAAERQRDAHLARGVELLLTAADTFRTQEQVVLADVEDTVVELALSIARTVLDRELATAPTPARTPSPVRSGSSPTTAP
jgi:hypothetical protein